MITHTKSVPKIKCKTGDEWDCTSKAARRVTGGSFKQIKRNMNRRIRRLSKLDIRTESI